MVAALNNGLRRPEQRPEPGKNPYNISVALPRHRQQIFNLYWVKKLPQTAIAAELHIAQCTVSWHVRAIQQAYAKAGVTLPRPDTTRAPKPKAPLARKKYTTPGVVEIDVCRLVNQLRDLRKMTRNVAVGDSMILGTIVNAIDDDTVLQEVARLVRPAAGGGKRHG